MANSERKKGVLLSYVSSLLLIAVNIFITPFLIRSLGDAEYGVYQMMASFGGYLVLMNFGTGTVMARFVSEFLSKKDKQGERNFIATCFVITACLVTLIAVASVVMFSFIDEIYKGSLNALQLQKAKMLFVIIAVNMIINMIWQAFQGIVTAYEKFVFNNSLSIVRTVLKAGLLLLIFLFFTDSLAIALVDLFISLVFLVGYSIYTFGVLKVRPKFYKFDKPVFLSAGFLALAVMLQAVVNQVNLHVDTTILGIMVSPERVTTYSVAMQIFQVFTSLSTAAVFIYLPKFTKLVSSGETSGKVLCEHIIPPSRVQTLVSGAITFGFFICGRDFIYMWMGEGYEFSWYVGIIIMIPTFFVYTNSVIEAVLDAMKKRMVKSVVLAVSALVNVFISIVLVYFLGEVGAPLGTAITTVAGSLIVLNLYYRKAIGLSLRELFFGIFKGILPCLLIATAVSLPLFILIPVSVWGLFVKGGVFVAVLFAALMIFGFNKEEKDIVVKFLKGKGIH